MSIQSVGLKAYTNALSNFTKTEKAIKSTSGEKPAQIASPFASTLKDSIAKVNDLQQEKKAMITSFAAGEQQNVHELMISLQKAGLAMNMTSAVRNKALEAYRELARMQF
ncbi:flagellar hook-basal body complex protein FliE [Desulfovibrio sp. OttesenSCG-928-O18]|nr:flagellar hook-basal body complex protein FliE [Desulfovibrio sp. OttesenSCG-928-O18]